MSAFFWDWSEMAAVDVLCVGVAKSQLPVSGCTGRLGGKRLSSTELHTWGDEPKNTGKKR